MACTQRPNPVRVKHIQEGVEDYEAIRVELAAHYDDVQIAKDSLNRVFLKEVSAAILQDTNAIRAYEGYLEQFASLKQLYGHIIDEYNTRLEELQQWAAQLPESDLTDEQLRETWDNYQADFGRFLDSEERALYDIRQWQLQFTQFTYSMKSLYGGTDTLPETFAPSLAPEN